MPSRPATFFLLACALTATLKAQPPRPEPKFAFEIPGPRGIPDNVTLTEDGALWLFHDQVLRRLTNGDPTRPLPSALMLEYNVKGDMVLIAASVFFGDFERRDLDALTEKKVGIYSAKLNESVRLSEMEQFGLEPLTVKIVPAHSPVSFRPRTFSKVPSVQIEITGQDRMSYNVTLRNLSTKAVTAAYIDMPEQNGGQSLTEDSGSKALIAPGATHELLFGIPHSGPNPQPPLLVLETAFFKDGSYEGDMQGAAQIAATRIGRETQRQRIHRLVEAILADTESDDAAKIARIRSETARITEEPEPEMIEKVLSQFPGLPETALRLVKFALLTGLNGEKQSLNHGLKEFERGKERSPNDTLARWWSVWWKP